MTKVEERVTRYSIYSDKVQVDVLKPNKVANRGHDSRIIIVYGAAVNPEEIQDFVEALERAKNLAESLLSNKEV